MAGQSWWDERAGFFGEFYMRGDHSVEGHLAARLQRVEERTKAEIEGIVHLLDMARPQRVLDVPCGYGRHAICLALRGHDVVGVDINEAHLSLARVKAIEQEVHPIFVKQNMLTISYRSEFDAVINMFYSFGFFETDAENLAVLENFFSALKPGGKFLMHTDVNIPRILDGRYKTDETRRLVDGSSLRISERYNEYSKRIEGAWTIESGSSTSTKPYSVRVYEESEFRDMCFQVGFVACDSYGGWDGQPYSRDSEEIIFVAKRSSSL